MRELIPQVKGCYESGIETCMRHCLVLKTVQTLVEKNVLLVRVLEPLEFTYSNVECEYVISHRGRGALLILYQLEKAELAVDYMEGAYFRVTTGEPKQTSLIAGMYQTQINELHQAILKQVKQNEGKSVRIPNKRTESSNPKTSKTK